MFVLGDKIIQISYLNFMIFLLGEKVCFYLHKEQ